MAPHCLLWLCASCLQSQVVLETCGLTGSCFKCWPCKHHDISPAKEVALLWGLGSLSLCL